MIELNKHKTVKITPNSFGNLNRLNPLALVFPRRNNRPAVIGFWFPVWGVLRCIHHHVCILTFIIAFLIFLIVSIWNLQIPQKGLKFKLFKIESYLATWIQRNQTNVENLKCKSNRHGSPKRPTGYHNIISRIYNMSFSEWWLNLRLINAMTTTNSGMWKRQDGIWFQWKRVKQTLTTLAVVWGLVNLSFSTLWKLPSRHS